MTVDTAKGRGQDYSTFTIIDVSTNPFEQVATFRDNNISPMLLPDLVYKYARTYNDAYVIIESNDQGEIVEIFETFGTFVEDDSTFPS